MEKEEAKTAEHKKHQKRTPSNTFGRIFLGLILVFVGIIYLLKTTGIIDIEINISIWQLWPLIIIFFGLSLINVRGWVSFLVGILLSLVVLVILFFAVFIGPNENIRWIKKPLIQKEVFIERAPKTFSADINMKFGAGEVKIKEGPSDKLIAGFFESSISDIKISEQSGAGVQRVLLEMDRVRFWRFWEKTQNVLELGLNQELPISLFIESGASNIDLDLRKIVAESIGIRTGASNLNLKLGNKQNKSDVKIESGASSLNIVLPKGSESRITIDSALMSKNIDGFQKIDEKTWETVNYPDSQKRIDLEIKAGVSDLNIKWE